MDSIVFATDNFASGNNTFDNASKTLYVSFVKETFLYLLMSVMRVSFHFNKSNIGDNIGLSMKFLLSLIICSQVAGTCLEPYPWPETFENQYDCMVFGYEESLKKIKQIGPEEVNTHNIYIRFICTPEQII